MYIQIFIYIASDILTHPCAIIHTSIQLGSKVALGALFSLSSYRNVIYDDHYSTLMITSEQLFVPVIQDTASYVAIAIWSWSYRLTYCGAMHVYSVVIATSNNIYAVAI